MSYKGLHKESFCDEYGDGRNDTPDERADRGETKKP